MKLVTKLLGVLLLALSFNASSAIVFGNDTFKFTGDAYIDITSDPTQTFGIGRVSTITEGANVIWSSGDDNQWLNFVFGSYNPVITPVAPIFNFLAENGFVNFFLNNAGTVFDTAASFATVSANIAAGDLFLSTVANGNTVGIGTPTAYSANGFLDVTGGLVGAQLDTNSRPTFIAGEFADLSFGLVGTNNQNPLVNSQYFYITSADAQGASQTTVAEPGTLLLMGLGLIGFGWVSRKRQTNAYLAQAAA